MKKKYDIFISYRRAGGFESANLIAEKLKSMGHSVFFDVESLRSGKFNEQLYGVIEQCKDFVVVLPQDALDRCSKADGNADDEDWLRKEVIFALTRNKNIIPVMLAGFEWPATMPAGLEALKDYQAITASSHDTFDLSMQRLAGYLKSKAHRFTPLKIISFGIAATAALIAIAYFTLLQVAQPLCTSVANECSLSMDLVHQLRSEEEELKTCWEDFLASYQAANTQRRKTDLETDLLDILQVTEANGEKVRQLIRPEMEMSEWQAVLIGLYKLQREDIQALPMMTTSYVDDLDTIASHIRRLVTTHSYKPYEVRNIQQNLQFYEHSVNMMYYAYLQEVTLLPEKSRKTHDTLSKGWNLLPTTPMSYSQEEYLRLMQTEYAKMEEIINKLAQANTIKENELYDMEQQLDSLENQDGNAK